MSLANTCDRCKKVITGPAMTDKEDFDVAVVIDGKPYYECEDMCPECRAEFVSMVDVFKRNESPAMPDVRPQPPEQPVEEDAEKHDDAHEDVAANEKEPDEPTPKVNQSATKEAYRSIPDEELPNAVTKRFPLPKPISPTQGTSR